DGIRDFHVTGVQTCALPISDQNERKVAFLLGEGIWRWRLDEFDRTEKSEFFDGVFGKLIQYLTTNDEKKKFKSSPTEQEFSDSRSEERRVGKDRGSGWSSTS